MKRIDSPRPGFYSVRLVRGGIVVGARIWFGQPIIDGEVQDRRHRLCIEVDGRTDYLARDQDGNVVGRVPLDVDERWPYLRDITEAEYNFLARRRVWATQHAPDHPAADARKAIDIRKLKPAW